MKLSEENMKKISSLFEEKYKKLRANKKKGEYSCKEEACSESWREYCLENEIFLVHNEELAGLHNEGGIKDLICFENPEVKYQYDEFVSDWLFISEEFALRVLVIGVLP